MTAERKNFVYGNDELDIPGCIRNGIPEEVANHIYDQMISFAAYAFNKSHAAAYAAIAMQTAYLKANYPEEFYAGLLTSVMDDTDKLAVYISECRKKQISVHNPDINSSYADFRTMDDGTICYGLASLKNVSRDALDSIVSDRAVNGEYLSLFNFIERNPDADKSLMESLINAGAFDFTGMNRPTMVNAIPEYKKALKKREKKNADQFDLFGMMEALSDPQVGTWPDYGPVEKVMKEKEVSGLFISYYPLSKVPDDNPGRKFIRQIPVIKNKIQKIGTREFDLKVIVSDIRVTSTKNGDRMAFLTLEDEYDTINAVMFPKEYEKEGKDIAKNDIAIIRCTANERNGEASLVILEFDKQCI